MQWREAWEERVDERLCSPSASERLARRLLDRWGVGCLNSLLFILFPWTLQGCLKRAADKRWTSVTTVQTNLEKIQAWVAGTPALWALNQAEKKLKTRMQALKTGSPPDRVVSDLVNLTIAIQAAADALQEVLEGESDLDADLSTLVIPIHGVVIPIREAVELWLHRHKAFSEEIEKASSQGNSSWRAFWWKQASDSSPSGFISRVAAGVTDSGSPKLAAGAWSSAQGSGEELQTHPWLGRGASAGREWKLISPFADGSAWLWLLLVFCDAHHHRFDENLTSGDRPWWTADRGEGRILWHTLRHKTRTLACTAPRRTGNADGRIVNAPPPPAWPSLPLPPCLAGASRDGAGLDGDAVASLSIGDGHPRPSAFEAALRSRKLFYREVWPEAARPASNPPREGGATTSSVAALGGTAAENGPALPGFLDMMSFSRCAPRTRLQVCHKSNHVPALAPPLTGSWCGASSP